MMHFIGQILPSDSACHFQSENGSLDGWIYLTSGWHQAHLAPFLHTSSTTAVGFIPHTLPLCMTRLTAPTWWCNKIKHTWHFGAWGHSGKKDIQEMTHLLSEWFLQPAPCWLFLFTAFYMWARSRLQPGWVLCQQQNLTAPLSSKLRETPSTTLQLGLWRLQSGRRSAGPKCGCGWELAVTARNRYWEHIDCPDQIYAVTASCIAWAKFKLPFPVGIKQITYTKAKEIQVRGCRHLFI